MKNNNSRDSQIKTIHWRGLGGWNFYFILKFALMGYGYLNFHPLYNLFFLAYLLCPLPYLFLHRLRRWIALPIGVALFYHDTWLPNIYSILSQGSSVFDFSWDYIHELADRFINWTMIGVGFILLVSYLYLSQWIRMTTLTIIALVWVNLLSIESPFLPRHATPSTTALANKKQPLTEEIKTSSVNSSNTAEPTNTNLNDYLNQFFSQQKTLHTAFPSSLKSDAQPFDVLLIQICSLAWADVESVQLENHPIWSKFDIFFDHFNSAASYSGPAAIRLLRASCGQMQHDQLYTPAPSYCYLMDNLERLGFTRELMLDHLGTFGDFLKEVREYGGVQQVPMISQQGIEVELTSFNAQPIYNDLELLNRWLDSRGKSTNPRSVTYFNTIVLHDGNRSLTDNKPIAYKVLTTHFLDEIDRFFSKLEQSGHKAMVVFIPEHGRNIAGDKLQMSGLRDIPSPDITHIPVGIKFFGMKAPHQDKPLKIDAPSSYLAVSDLISRVVNGEIFTQDRVDFLSLTQGLPETTAVSENMGVTVMDYQHKYYILLKGESSWIPYP